MEMPQEESMMLKNGVIIANADAEITQMNAGAEKLTGWREGEGTMSINSTTQTRTNPH